MQPPRRLEGFLFFGLYWFVVFFFFRITILLCSLCCILLCILCIYYALSAVTVPPFGRNWHRLFGGYVVALLAVLYATFGRI